MNPTNPLPNPTASRLTFGVWMKTQRKRLDLTQAALAQQIGCAAVTIKQIESGQRRPSRQIVALLTTALEIPAAEQAAFLHAARTPPASAAPASAEATPRATSPGTSPEASLQSEDCDRSYHGAVH